MTGLAPLPGFEWRKVKWAAPDAPQPTTCCYCDAPLRLEDDDAPPDPDDDDPYGMGPGEPFVPLMMWSEAGACAAFCEACMQRWWGFAPSPAGTPGSAA